MPALTRGISQLATPFFVFQAKPSTIQRQRVGWLHFDERLRNLCTTIITSENIRLLRPSISIQHADLHFMLACAFALIRRERTDSQSEIFSKEVIRPQVPLRPPCYDFSPVAELGFDNANKTLPRPSPTSVKRRAVCARSRDVFTARW
jgi:hypothetical protein